MAKKRKSFKDYTALSTLSAKWVLQNLPYVLFLGILGTIYIANRHYAEKNVRDIQTIQEDVEKLRWHYLSLKSTLMQESKHSEINRKMKEKGLGNTGKQPVKINVE